MAYSSDYIIGEICESINSQYAQSYGYQFWSQKINYEEMMKMISPRQHCGWYKALLIRNFLSHHHELPQQSSPPPTNWKYLVWIDADAVILNFTLSIEDIIYHNFTSISHLNSSLASTPRPPPSQSTNFPDLIIAQDFSTSSSCPLNSGVMIIQNSSWNQSLWNDVWSHPFCEKYHHVYFYDQSALIKCLKLRNIHFPSCYSSPFEDLSQQGVAAREGDGEGEEKREVTDPFHYLRETHMTRIRILPCSLLNSNRILPQRIKQFHDQTKNELNAIPPPPPAPVTGPHISIQHLIHPSHSPHNGTKDDQDSSFKYDLSDVDCELTEGLSLSLPLLPLSNSNNEALFIFHAVGGWNKMKAIFRVCQLYDLISPEDIDQYCQIKGIDFRLYRGKCGGIPIKEKKNNMNS